MADTAVRLRYAGETRPVEIKQSAWEDSAAHPEHAGVDGRTGGATEQRVSDLSRHDGANCRWWWCSGGCGG